MVVRLVDPSLRDYGEWPARYDEDPPEVDLDALARDPAHARHFRDDPDDFCYDPAAPAELDAAGPPAPDRIY